MSKGEYVTKRKLKKEIGKLKVRIEMLEDLHKWQLKEAKESGGNASHIADKDLDKHVL